MTGGMLLVLSAPSGGGKSTMLKEVMAGLPGLVFSVSHTTRPPRAGEENGREYHFVSRATFLSIQQRQPSGFLEWAEVHGNLYGTGREEVEQHLQAGKDVVLDIDVQGAMQVMESADPVTVFITPPSLDELEKRLRGRGTESEDNIAMRLKNARTELVYKDRYDYLVVNDRLHEAIESLRAIIVAERCRRRRSLNGETLNLAGLRG
ncbi:MAG: guanylate kinase [Desulfobulbaceae bacterium]|nr:guanylate kinase [Desulfobulbaceae bacterium]